MHYRQFTQHSAFSIRHSARPRAAMTLIELLIVIVIIGVLVSAVMVASTSLIRKSKTRNTQAVLQIVSDAVEQFKRDQTEKPTITQNAAYKRRYGFYPPDELEAFSQQGVPKAPTIRLLVPSASATTNVIPSPAPYQAMRFYSDGTAADAAEHRDLAAMILAIELHSESAKAILDRIPDRNRSAGIVDSSGKPIQYLDRDGNGVFGPDDEQIRLILDDWGIPLTYYAQRDNNPLQDDATRSSNLKDWNHVSTEIIKLNDGKPLIMSYGPDGKEQLTKEFMEDQGKATIVYDFENFYGPPVDGDVVDHPLNADNIYSKQGLAELLLKGLP